MGMKWCLILCLLLFLPVMVVAQLHPPPPRPKWSILGLAHPDAKLLMGIAWKRALASPLGAVIRKQVAIGGHPLLAFLDSIDNVERFLVSSPGTPEDGAGRPPLLVVGEGQFSLAQVRAMAKADGAVSRRFNDVELLVPPDATNADLHFALLDATTILFGDGTSVKAAIVRRQNQEPSQSELIKRAGVLSATQEAWVLAKDPSQAFPGIGITSSPLAAEVESVELQVAAGDSLSASVAIKAATPEAAETLGTGLPALMNLLALTYSGQPSLTQVARRLRTVTEQNYVKMGFTLDGKLLNQSLNELREASVPVVSKAVVPATDQGAMPSSSVPTPGVRIPDPGPAPKRVIRIVGGMDDGVREIPYEVKKP